MRQVLQDLAKGDTLLVDAPAPAPSAGHVIVHTTVSLISAGTERMLVDFGKASMLNKARQQPERVRMVLDKVRTDGCLPRSTRCAQSSTSRCRWATAMLAWSPLLEAASRAWRQATAYCRMAPTPMS